MRIPEPGHPKHKIWVERITFITENVMNKQESIELFDNRIYFVFIGKLAMGKRIVEEHEFIIGKTGRRVIALRTTSLICLVIQKQMP